MKETTLTRGQKARVKLLLRCAADAAISGNFDLRPSWSTPARLGIKKPDLDIATRAVQHVAKDMGRDPEKAKDADAYATIMLEAARRVEEGSWP
jgi:hypothetical protein